MNKNCIEDLKSKDKLLFANHNKIIKLKLTLKIKLLTSDDEIDSIAELQLAIVSKYSKNDFKNEMYKNRQWLL
jgi:hypothetical protein